MFSVIINLKVSLYTSWGTFDKLYFTQLTKNLNIQSL